MDSSSTLTEALLSAAVVLAFFYIAARCLYRVVIWARRQSKKAFVVGAALAPFIALGNVGDPDLRIVQEAKRLKNREDDDPGDPPDPEDAGILRTAAELAANKREHPVRRKDGEIESASKPARPLSVWVISIAVGLMAVVSSLVLAWLLLAEPALLVQARLVRKSLSAFDWGLLLVLYMTLLTSTIMLFRLRKNAVRLFVVYLALGGLATAWYALTPEHEAHFDLGVTLFCGMPVALGMLVYMLRLKRRAVLA